MSDKAFRKRVLEFLDDLEYDLYAQFEFEDKPTAYKLGVYKELVNQARNTIQNFRRQEGITRETSNDFDTNPMTII